VRGDALAGLPRPVQIRSPDTSGLALRYNDAATHMPTSDIARVLIVVGIVALVAGLLLLLWPKAQMLGHLPGDLSFERNGVRVYIPIATTLIISLVLTIVVNVVLRLFK